MEWVGPLIERFGLPVGILIVVSIILWRIILFLGTRLFDEDRGYITVLVKEHLAMMRDHRSAMSNILASSRETATMLVNVQSGLAVLSEDIGRDMRKYETTNTNEALVKLALALKIMAEGYGIDIQSEIERIKEILEDD